MKLLAFLSIAVLMLVAVACAGDGDEPEATATTESVPTLAPPTEVAASPTAPSPTATVEPSLPPTDGTVFPQNPGSTDSFPMKSNPDPNVGLYVLDDVRVGAHPESGGWDRIVFEFEDVPGFPGAHPAGVVEYTDEVFQCGSGMPVLVEGEAILQVRFDATQAHNDAGQLTIDALEIEGPGNSIIAAESFCDFEGVVQWAIGTSGEENFKVVFLADPNRVVIDVRWP
jgi:hypothetical protein